MTVPNPQDASEKMLAKIRALLAKAENAAATPEEAEAYTAKAAELMAKYGVDRAMLAVSDPGSDIPGDRVIVVPAPYALDKQQMLGAVAHTAGCRAALRKRWERSEAAYVHEVHLFGYASALERTEMLYTSLLVQAANGLAQTPVPRWDHPAAFRRSWLNGFTVAIVQRLKESEKRAQRQATEEHQRSGHSGPSVELVLADRAKVIGDRFAEAYPKIRSADRRTLSGGGRADGYDAGRRADLGGARVGGRKALGAAQ